MFWVIGLAVLWDAVKLTLPGVWLHPFVVIDPTYLGATTAIARNLLQD